MTVRRRIRVVYVVGTLDVGGTEKQVVETAIRLDGERFLPMVYCFSEGGPLKAVLDEHGIDVTLLNESIQASLSLRSKIKRYGRKFWHLLRYLKQVQPDIVHSYLFSPSIFAGFAATLACVPVVISSRRCLGVFKDRNIPFQFLENVVNRLADGVLVNSEALRADVLARERIRAEKVQVIYNGLDLQAFHPVFDMTVSSVQRRKQQCNIPVSSPVVGMVANLIPYKGHNDVLQAAAAVLQQIPNARFVCVGDDRGILPQLEQLCDTLGIRDRVIFMGHVSTVADILPMFTVQVSASHEEGFSNAILEGMAAGKPVVATTVGGTPEAVLHRVTGLLVPPRAPDALAEAILQVLMRPHLAEQFGRNGRARVEQCFSMEKMIDKLETVYCHYLESGSMPQSQKPCENEERL